MHHTILLSAIALLTAVGLSHAAEPNDARTALQKYRSHTNVALYVCRLKLQGAILQQQPGASTEPDLSLSNWRECIVQNRDEALPLYQAAAKTLRKPAAREALKTYHTIFQSTLTGVQPGESERTVSYRERQLQADTRLLEAWTRVEIEQ